jgi:uncharacterized protein (TIGR03000 family)
MGHRLIFVSALLLVAFTGMTLAGPFRGIRRWYQPVISPYVEFNADNLQPYTLFPPGHATITTEPGPAAVIPDEPATVRVLVPDAGAELSFNGQKSSATGTSRTFRTPDLKVGLAYHYRVELTWTRAGRPMREERRVEVHAGRTTTVDFTKPAVETLPPPQ